MIGSVKGGFETGRGGRTSKADEAAILERLPKNELAAAPPSTTGFDPNPVGEAPVRLIPKPH